MAYNGYGYWSLIASVLIDQIMDSAVLFITTKWVPKFAISFRESVPLIAFGRNILLSELVSRGYEQVRLLVIGKAYSGSVLAFNSKGQTLPAAIIDVTNTTIMRVMFPALSILQDNPTQMKYVASKSISMSSFILAPAMIGMFAMSNRLIPFLYTDKWSACIPYLQLYCITYLFQPIHTMDLKIIQACGKSDISLKIELIKKTMGFVFLFCAIIFFDSAIYAAASFTVMSFIALLINSIPCKKLIDYGFFEQMKDVAPAILTASVMGIVVSCVGKLPFNDIVIIFTQLIIGFVVYALLALLTKQKPALLIIDLILQKKKG